MSINLDIIQKLDSKDQEKIQYFLKILLDQKKYEKLKKELEQRRTEIKKGQTLTHDEIWKKLNV